MTHCVTKATPNNVLTTSSAITGKHTHMSIKFRGLIFCILISKKIRGVLIYVAMAAWKAQL